MKKNATKKKRIIRHFKINPEYGAAALLVGSSAEGLPLQSMTRKGDKVIAIYSKEII